MRNLMLCLKSKKVNFEDCLYLFLKKTKQTKKPKIYRNDGEGKRMMLFFVLQMFYVLKCGHAKSINALGPGQLEFDVKLH